MLGTISRTQIPILIIIGGHDQGNQASCSALARLVPGAKCIRIPNAGHLANLECPKQFNQVLQQFLSSTSPGLEITTR